ncbi:hypothetical protein V6N13_070309 [Hibiscus sabdariffa]
MWKPILCSTIATWRIMKEFLEQRSQEEDWLSLELVQVLWGREVNVLAVKVEKCTGDEEHDFRVRFPQGKGIEA